MAPGEEREGQFDDLFEDLDKFFDPDEEAREGEHPRDPAASSEREPAPSPDSSPPGGTEALHDDEEILPPGWQEVGDLELGMDTGEHPPIEPWPPAGPEGGEEGPAGGETDEPGPLSVEDLKKAPPVYRDLPGPGSDEPRRPESEPEAAAAAAIASPDSAWSEPAISEVEAAADQLAQEFGATPDDIDDDLLVDLHAPSPRTVKVEPEEMTGPSWEEPTSRPLRSEPLGPGGRNLPAAVITAVALVALALITVALRRWAFALVAGGLVLVGQAELFATMQRRGHQPATALGLVMGGLVMGAAYFKGGGATVVMGGLALI